MKFTKMHGAGNDFVVIDARGQQCDWAGLAKAMCHRNFGIGADGLILVSPAARAEVSMRMFNPDGSEAEACGNGLRCVVKYAIEHGLARGPRLAISTQAGLLEVEATVKDDRVVRSRVSLGTPRLAPKDIPVGLAGDGPIIDHTLVVEKTTLKLTCVSMGNPHAVHFLDSPVADFPLGIIGPKVEHHPLFPQRVNFEIARVLAPGKLEARTWERGAGETLACGSGACAIAVAARLKGLATGSVEIAEPGGVLTVDWDGKGEAYLSGPAEAVFEGEWAELA